MRATPSLPEPSPLDICLLPDIEEGKFGWKQTETRNPKLGNSKSRRKKYGCSRILMNQKSFVQLYNGRFTDFL
ncbi:unnamed protein product, partial [Musa textilis]